MRCAVETGLWLIDQGFSVFVPHVAFGGWLFDAGVPENVVLEMCEGEVRRHDFLCASQRRGAVLKSCGAMLEERVAKQDGFPVFCTKEEVLSYEWK